MGADCSGPKAMGKKKKKPFAAAIDNSSLHVVGSKLKILFSDGREAECCHVAEES